MRSAASSGCCYRDVERLSARVGNLDRHFGQAQKDIEEIRISADQAQGRARRLEAIDFAPEGDAEELPAAGGGSSATVDMLESAARRGRLRGRNRGDPPWRSSPSTTIPTATRW